MTNPIFRQKITLTCRRHVGLCPHFKPSSRQTRPWCFFLASIHPLLIINKGLKKNNFVFQDKTNTDIHLFKIAKQCCTVIKN